MVRRFVFSGVLFAVLITVVVVGLLLRHSAVPSYCAAPPHELVDQTALKRLPHKSASSADLSHVASDLVPPTNMWLSGMVLQKTPEAVYPMPLSFLAKDTGFEVGLPSVHSTATQISGEHTPGITADIGATGFTLTRYDKLSATLSYRKDTQVLGGLTVTEGSPFVFYTAATSGTVAISDINPADILEHNSHYVRYNRTGHTYVVSTQQGTITLTSSGLSIAAKKGTLVTFYALPSTTDTLRQYVGNAIQSVTVSHKQSGKNVSTTFTYKTSTGKPTIFASLPYENLGGKSTVTYQSIWGQLRAFAGMVFTITTPTITATDELDLSHLTTSQSNQLIASLPADVASTKVDQQDSYFAGKQLARAANLLSIAKQLHQDESAAKLKAILEDAFGARLGTGYFYYDTGLKGVAATTAAFGSEDFNDHHFHYGYWLYAASILGKYDTSFVSRYENQLNLLAADIASYEPGSNFPLERNYDPYAGHSWAAGLAPFADGNNQESSSEAMHAWNGVALWGQLTKNQPLAQMGTWMLANEARTAQAAWRSVDMNSPALKNYTSPISSLNFGGKRTYATFFSDEPAAKLGIQLIPLDPSMLSFASDKSHIATVVNASIQNDNFNVPLGDYVLMYLALHDSQKAAGLAKNQQTIDDGNSPTYLDAWIFNLLAK